MQGIGHMKRRCPSRKQPAQGQATLAALNLSENQNSPAVLCVKSSGPEMCIHVLLYDKEISALLDSGARRNVIPSKYFDNIDSDVRPLLQASLVQSLQGISSANVNVRGEIYLPIQIGSRTVSVNFLVADVAENTGAILGHLFLEQSRARLDQKVTSQKIVLFGEQVPYFNPDKKPKVHIVRIARTTVLESGYEYIVPGNAYFREPIGGDVLLSPTKGFVEKHQVLMARVVVDTPYNNHVPIRLYNPGAAPVRVKKGTIAGVLQAADVVQPPQERAEHGPAAYRPDQNSSVPVHLQQLYTESRGLAELLSAYRDVFSKGPNDLSRTGLIKHDIQTLPGSPVKQHPRRMAFEKQVDADNQIQASLESGLACPSQSSWASPIVMVRKKDKTFRMCVDYRALNERTVKDAYPLPRIQDTLDTLSTARWFSTLDLASGYWQVELTPRARRAAAFCSRKGLFEWSIMPFGLCNAPATFQRLMDRVLVGLQWETCLVYLDDIIILGSDVEQMLQRLSQVFDRLRQANLNALSRRPCRDVCPCKVPDPKQSKENFTDQAVQCDLGALAMDSTTDSSPAVMDSVGVGPSAKPSGENPDRNKEAVRVVVGRGARAALLGAAAKSYWSQWDRLYLRDDILLRRFYQVEDAVYYPQIILPQAFRQDVLKQMHDGPSCAAKARPRKTPRAPMGTVRVGVPMERIAIDLMGPMNETERYNRYILVVQDYFTKWVEAYPLPDEQAVTVAEVLVAQWVCRFGAPQVVHSDQGSNFQSEVFQRMCQLLGVEKTNTTPFRPQSNGQVERFNATLQKILSTTAERCHWEWDLMIPFALMAYRATTHSSTGFTPNMMLLGREVTEPIDLVAGLPPGHEYEKTPSQYVLQLRDRFELAHQIAREA
ncbi:hypothetical protein ACEWY4_005941 [Coilia grayii]|uniref:ribonuclease H n=1 Tax=Coilia grayii TaxID=363190 RepID=A0ABD1KJU8_9TELE